MEFCEKLGTKEQKERLEKLIKNYVSLKWTTVKLLQEVQKIYGYLPRVVLEYVCKNSSCVLSELFSVASFYAEFSLSPKGKYPISVCMGTACYVNGAEGIYEKICQTLKIKAGESTKDGRFSIDQTRCIGCCGMAPVVTIGEEVFGNVELKMVDAILAKFMEK